MTVPMRSSEASINPNLRSRGDIEFASGIEIEHPECADRAVEHLRAQHRALVVDHGENYGPLAEEISQPDIPSAFIGERQVERHLLMQVLIDSDLLQQSRLDVGRLPRGLWRHTLRPQRWAYGE